MLKLKSRFGQHDPVSVMGVHDAISAKIAQEIGFEAVWLSGLELSASYGVPDLNFISLSELVDAARRITRSVEIPVIVDCDSGFGDVKNVMYMVELMESANVSGICIEDKLFPKSNSFLENTKDMQEPIEDFCTKILGAKKIQKSPDTLIIARIESLITQSGMRDALQRAEVYIDAGADAILIHSKSKTPNEIIEFMSQYSKRKPVFVVPTTYPMFGESMARENGVAGIIYANQGLRAAISAYRKTFKDIKESDSHEIIDGTLSSVRDVFNLQNTFHYIESEKEYRQQSNRITLGEAYVY